MCDNLTYASTLALHGTHVDKIDQSWYAKAINAGNIGDFDYYLARVSANPELSENLRGLGYTRHARPVTKRAIIGMSESSMETGRYELHDTSGNIGISSTKASEIAKINAEVNSVVDELVKHKQKVNLLKIFAFYLVLSGASDFVKHPMLNSFMKYFKEQPYEDMKFKLLHTYCKTAHAAIRDRDTFRKIYASVVSK